MKKSTEPRIDELLERYFNSESTSCEEKRLRDWARESSGREQPSDEAARILLAGFAALAGERMPERRRHAPAVPLRRSGIRRFAVAAAIAATVTVGAFTTWHILNRPYCYIDGVPVRDKQEAMRMLAYLEPLEQFGRTVELLDRMIAKPEKDQSNK